MMFTFYIRMMIENYLLYSLTSLYEIHQYDTSTKSRHTSLIISILIGSSLLMFLIFNLTLWAMSKNPYTFHGKYYFSELFDGIKLNYCKRMYMSMFIARRLAFVCIVIFFNDRIYRLKLLLFSLIQLTYLSLVISMRFHERWDHNLNEVINEV